MDHDRLHAGLGHRHPADRWAAHRFGTKRLCIAALVLFTAGSVLCAAADSIKMLIAFRVLQGLGGGMLMTLGMTIMTRAAGPDRIGRLMAVLGIPMLLDPISGPILVAIASQMKPELIEALGLPGELVQRGLAFAADAFASTFMVALGLVLVAFIAALFRPRTKEESHLLDDADGDVTPILMH